MGQRSQGVSGDHYFLHSRSWAIWEQIAWLWKTLSAVAGLIAIVYPILEVKHEMEAMIRLSGKWSELEESYEQLWNGLTSIQEKAGVDRVQEAQGYRSQA